jgi:hypothetical protein
MVNLLAEESKVTRHVPDELIGRAVQRVVSRDEQLVRAPSRPPLGQQRGGGLPIRA